MSARVQSVCVNDNFRHNSGLACVPPHRVTRRCHDSLGFVGELGPVGDDPSDDGDTIDDESILHVRLGDSCNLASIVTGANHSNTTGKTKCKECLVAGA